MTKRRIQLLSVVVLLYAATAHGQEALVYGPTRVGQTVPPGKPPVMVGGIDASGNAQAARVTSSGAVAVDAAPAWASCKTAAVNAQGAAGASVVVASTAGGVTVLAASTDRCGAVIANTGPADMRCAPTGLTPTATLGYPLSAGQWIQLGTEAQQAWKCISTGTSTSASTVEAIP